MYEIALVKPVTILGRDPECDIALADATVSSQHAALRFVNGMVQVADLVSTNGTRINGRRAVLQMIKHLDVLHLGRCELRFTDYRGAGAAADHLAPEPRENEMPNPEPEPVGSGPSAELALRVLHGERFGDTISLTLPNTMIGDPATGSALVVRRAGIHFVARLGGGLRLNSRDLEPGSHPITVDDLIEVGRSGFKVVSRPIPTPAPGPAHASWDDAVPATRATEPMILELLRI